MVATIAALLLFALFYRRKTLISRRVLEFAQVSPRSSRPKPLLFLDSLFEKKFSQVLLYRALETQLVRGNSKVGPGRFLVDSIVWTVVAASIGFWAQGFLGMTLAFLLCLGLRFYQPQLVVKRRQAKFQDQFDYTVNLLSASLKAGYSLIRTIEIISIQSEAPTSQEFAYALNSMRMGKDMGAAVHEISTRMNSLELEWVAQSINIHRESGGDLSVMFDTVASTIKDRNSIRVLTRTLSTDGRVSGQVMSVMPLAILLIFGAQRPESFTVFFDTQLGNTLLTLAVVLYAIGVLWIRKIVRVRF